VNGFILAALAYWRKLKIEEANLAVAFGTAWSDYRGFVAERLLKI
jgi:hypothetical protein